MAISASCHLISLLLFASIWIYYQYSIWHVPIRSLINVCIRNDSTDGVGVHKNNYLWQVKFQEYFHLSGTHDIDYRSLFIARLRKWIGARPGVIESSFQVSKNTVIASYPFQRNERRKWIWHLEDSSLIFIVNLDSYYKYLRYWSTNSIRACTLNNINEMEEQRIFFESVFERFSLMNSYRNNYVFLFFNKRDLFEQSLKTKPLSQFFPGYTGLSHKIALTSFRTK